MTRGRGGLHVLAALAVLLFGSVWVRPAARAVEADPAVLTVEVAAARFEPQGLPAVERPRADLFRRWDLDFPGRDGRAIYRVALPRHLGAEPMAVLFSRVGNQVRVTLNGALLQHWGRLGDPSDDAGKEAHMLVLPAGLLRADAGNELVVEVTVQQQRWGGLSVLGYGPQDLIEPMYQHQVRWRHSAVIVFGWSLAAMALLAAALWWQQRDPLYGCFSLAALLGMVRDLDRVWPDIPIPWPAWGAIEAACYAVHLALIARFVLMAIGAATPALRRLNGAVIVGTASLAAIGFPSRLPLLWTLALASLIPLGMVSIVAVVRAAWRERNGRSAALVATGAMAVAAGTYDFTVIRIGRSSGFHIQLTPPAMFAFVLVLGGIVVQRYGRAVADYRALNAVLAQRVADRERQLQAAYDALREKDRRQSIAEERERIMQDIHDGVGSQLVGLLQFVRTPAPDPRTLALHVTQALDEMRMAVDSMQPAQDDLVTVLATLRHRLQPRLVAAGITTVWQVSDLPSLLPLSSDTVRQVQRVVMEAVTNVLRHAGATRIVVETYKRVDPAVVGLRITDDGVGLAADPGLAATAGGRGLGGMRRRAEAMGAEIRFESGATRGFSVSLEWRIATDRPAE